MPIRQIVYTDNPILRKKVKKVYDFNKELHSLIDDMVETMIDAPGVGLAAPQVNVDKRVIVVRLPDDEESVEEFGDLAGVLYELINPDIIRESREVVDGVEACLSIPGYFGTVERPTSIVVRAQDRHGKDIKVKAKDWLARVFFHEIDHLNGILFTDLASEVWKAGEHPPSVQAEIDEENEAVEENDA